jgi:hypothetical protein
MKKLIVAILLLSFVPLANARGLNWIHEAFTADFHGFDCGSYTQKPIEAPAVIQERQIEFFKMSTDKKLTNFLVQASYPGMNGEECTTAIMLKRNKKTFKMHFVFAKSVSTTEDVSHCEDTQKFLESILKVNYYGATHGNYEFVGLELDGDLVPTECSASFPAQLVFKRSN